MKRGKKKPPMFPQVAEIHTLADILSASAQLVFFHAVSRVRSVFSESVKEVRLGNGGPPGNDAVAASVWRAITRVLRSCYPFPTASSNIFADVVNAMLPSDCSVCGGPMVGLGRIPVCGACSRQVSAHRVEELGPLCERCGDTLGMESARFAAGLSKYPEKLECTMCRLAPPEFARAVAYASYDFEVREMLHLLKFNGMRAVADQVLGEAMASAVVKLEGQASPDLMVVPVPLFRARQRSRGFNQAQVLAEAGMAELKKLRPEWKLEMKSGVLLRVRDTRAQFALAPRIRRRNLRGAFRVEDAAAIKGREILLVDDILTTGATARECTRVLLRAGAAKVWVATMARAQTEGSASTSRDVAMWTADKQPGAATGFL